METVGEEWEWVEGGWWVLSLKNFNELNENIAKKLVESICALENVENFKFLITQSWAVNDISVR